MLEISGREGKWCTTMDALDKLDLTLNYGLSRTEPIAFFVYNSFFYKVWKLNYISSYLNYNERFEATVEVNNAVVYVVVVVIVVVVILTRGFLLAANCNKQYLLPPLLLLLLLPPLLLTKI